MPRPRPAPLPKRQAKPSQINETKRNSNSFAHKVKTVGDHQSNDEPIEPEVAERTGSGAMSMSQLTGSSAVNTVISTILLCFISKLIVS